jgi:hypothetical protein
MRDAALGLPPAKRLLRRRRSRCSAQLLGPLSKGLYGEAGSVDIGTQGLGERVVTRHRVLLAAFLMQSHRPPGAARPQILDLHLQRCIDTREAVGEGGDQCPVTQIAQCRVRDPLEGRYQCVRSEGKGGQGAGLRDTPSPTMWPRAARVFAMLRAAYGPLLGWDAGPTELPVSLGHLSQDPKVRT